MAVNPIPRPNEKLVRIFDTEQESEAMVVRGLLESAGIDAEIGDSENAPDVLPVGGIGLLVREEDAEHAREVIAEYRRTPEQVGTDADTEALEDSGPSEAGQE